MKRFYEYEEEFFVGKYEFSSNRITRTDYDFSCRRETRIYEEDTFWMEEKSEVYCNIRATRIA